jgi:hypothetical protein
MSKTDPREPESLPEPPPQRAGQTTPAKDALRAHKQPHERDESSASQQRQPDEQMELARKDVAEGRADTSRAEATDATYARNLRSEPQGAPGTPSAKGDKTP